MYIVDRGHPVGLPNILPYFFAALTFSHLNFAAVLSLARWAADFFFRFLGSAVGEVAGDGVVVSEEVRRPA
jgi:hypothetical protein